MAIQAWFGMEEEESTIIYKELIKMELILFALTCLYLLKNIGIIIMIYKNLVYVLLNNNKFIYIFY